MVNVQSYVQQPIKVAFFLMSQYPSDFEVEDDLDVSMPIDDLACEMVVDELICPMLTTWMWLATAPASVLDDDSGLDGGGDLGDNHSGLASATSSQTVLVQQPMYLTKK